MHKADSYQSIIHWLMSPKRAIYDAKGKFVDPSAPGKWKHIEVRRRTRRTLSSGAESVALAFADGSKYRVTVEKIK